MISSPAKQQFQQHLTSVSLPPPPPPPLSQAVVSQSGNTIVSATSAASTTMILKSPTLKMSTPPSVPSMEEDIDCDGK